MKAMKLIVPALLILFGISWEAAGQNPLPTVAAGKIERIENFKSRYVTPRNVDVWLPEGYAKTKKYGVLYMHDGQMLFDPRQTWNKQAWDVDDVAAGLFRSGNIGEFIVVGIWNGGITRHSDYFPQKPFEQMTAGARDTVIAELQKAGRTKDVFQPQSDAYLRFLAEEVKPYIDKHYSVNPGRESTFIAGSSMGGLISVYALCEYPQVFGGAACLSTHWVGTFSLENNPIPEAFIRYLDQHLPDPANHKIYFDCGDQTLDALYPDIQKKVDALMVSKGYTPQSWITKYFPGEDHSEKAWNKRLDIPLRFLFGK